MKLIQRLRWWFYDRLGATPKTMDAAFRPPISEPVLEDFTDPGGRRLKIHSSSICGGPPCPFHSSSTHHMQDWPMIVRASGLIERQCPHGIGHPDPDAVLWMEKISEPGSSGTWGVHGCDGCCTRPKVSTGSAKGSFPRSLPN